MNGRVSIAKIIDIYFNSGKQLSLTDWEAEKQHWLNTPVQDKPKEVINLDRARSQTAQLRELTKVQQEVIANEQKIVEAVSLTKSTIDKIYPKQ